ncbi:MAG: hypothetical protein JG770_121 [Mahella sp.]|nr:hypothetical protein [Mahella sp.]
MQNEHMLTDNTTPPVSRYITGTREIPATYLFIKRAMDITLSVIAWIPVIS